MPQVTINYFAVLVATVTAMVIGSIWYAKPVFGKKWMMLIGKSQEDLKKGRGPAYGGMLVLAFVLAYVLAHFVQYTDATTLGEGVVTGFWVWLGFVVTTKGASHLFAGKPLSLYLIDVGYHLVELLVMGAILAVWQ